MQTSHVPLILPRLRIPGILQPEPMQKLLETAMFRQYLCKVEIDLTMLSIDPTRYIRNWVQRPLTMVSHALCHCSNEATLLTRRTCTESLLLKHSTSSFRSMSIGIIPAMTQTARYDMVRYIALPNWDLVFPMQYYGSDYRIRNCFSNFRKFYSPHIEERYFFNGRKMT